MLECGDSRVVLAIFIGAIGCPVLVDLRAEGYIKGRSLALGGDLAELIFHCLGVFCVPRLGQQL